MKILVVGAGGVGGYFGGKLALHEDVTFLARGEHGLAMQKNGLEVKSIEGDFKIPHPKIIYELGESNQKFDLILIATKSYQLEEVAKKLMPHMHTSTLVLPLLNGINAENTLARYIPTENVVHGLCKIFSKIHSPGIIEHFGYKPTLFFGKVYQVDKTLLSTLAEMLTRNQFHYFYTEDILTEKWNKFLFICSGGLTAYYNCTYGELLEDEKKVKELEELFNEIFILGQKKNIPLKDDLVQRTMEMIKDFPYHATSSMQRDIAAGNLSELEELNGEVVRQAKREDFPIPINEMIYNRFRRM